MTCKRNRLKNLSLIVVPALTLVSLIGATSPVFASSVVVVSNGSAAEEKLEELATTYTNVYFALGVCDGFIAPEEEAPFDPFGPALEKWPDSFKHRMVQTREEGRIESRRLALKHRFTVAERTRLCRGELDSATTDLDRVRAKYSN
jgi:hypothetical protein